MILVRTLWLIIVLASLALTGAAGVSSGGSGSGHEILFTGTLAGHPGVHVLAIRADGTGLRLVAPGGTEGYLPQNPKPSPDGSQVVFGGNTTEPGLFIVAASGGTPRRIADGFDSPLGWSPNGRWIAFQHFMSGTAAGLYVVSPRGTGLRKIWSAATEASWAPGSKHLFVTDPKRGIVIANLAGRGRLVANTSCGAAAESSPDDSWIVFHRCDRDREHLRIARVRSDGSGFRWLTKPRSQWEDAYPVVSPDGRTVAFQRSRLAPGEEAAGILTVDLDGRHLRVLDPAAAWHDERPRWSPDGQMIAFDRDSAIEPGADPARLGVIDFADAETRIIYRYINPWTQVWLS